MTVHDHDWKRIMRTLQPVYDHYVNQAKRLFKEDRVKELRDKLKNGDILSE
jgi:hypothetical protein